jgi:hypothetical protein
MEGTSLILRLPLYLCWHLLLLLPPALAAVLAGAQRGLTCKVRLFAVGACAMAAAGYASLWLYLWAIPGGQAFTCIAAGASVAYIIRTWRRKPECVAFAIRTFRYPVAWWLLATVLYLSLGFLYGGMEFPMQTAAFRYFQWASDNELPFVYAAKILHVPLAPWWTQWNVYARPPLMTGIVLFLLPVGLGYGTYQVAGVLLQAFVVPCVWCFLEALGVSRRAVAVCVFMCVFSVFVLMNAFFVWPKLLPAGFLFIAAGLLFGRSERHAADPYLAGAALGFAGLSHGGSVFGAMAILIVLVTARPLGGRLAAYAKTVVTAAALLLPWSVYANTSGMPTGELVGWHLGGILPQGVARGESSWAVIQRGYSSLSAREIIANKAANFRFQFAVGNGLDGAWRRSSAAGMRVTAELIFSRTVYVVAVPLAALLLIPFALLRKRREADPRNLRAAAVAGALGLAGTVVWCLIMFGPKMAVTDAAGSSAIAALPQGSFWPPLCLLLSLSLVVDSFGGPARALMLIFQTVLFIAIGAHARYETSALVPLSPSVLNGGMAAGAALSAMALAVCSFWYTREARQP